MTRYLEPQIMAVMTMEAQSTTDIIKALYGPDYPYIEAARVQVHKALVCLQSDGDIESKLCHLDGDLPHKAVRFWGLVGCTYPHAEGQPLTDRITVALADGPMRIDDLCAAVFSQDELADRRSRSRLIKALNRLREARRVERIRDPVTNALTPSTWRLTP